MYVRIVCMVLRLNIYVRQTVGRQSNNKCCLSSSRFLRKNVCHVVLMYFIYARMAATLVVVVEVTAMSAEHKGNSAGS